MPTAYIKQLSKDGYGSIATLEKRWDEAKEAAAKQDRGDDYAYITGILKRMVGASMLASIEISANERIKKATLADMSTGQAAGAIFYARDTGRLLLVKRSTTGDAPNTWACLGGGIEQGETIEEGVARECREEAGYDGPMELIHFHTSGEDGNFQYHNHVALVDNEFEPKLNHEHTEHKWCEFGDYPEPLHPKFEAALSNPSYSSTILAQ